MFPVRRSLIKFICLSPLLLAGGCGNDDINVYRVPKEPPAPSELPAGHPDISAAPAKLQLTWTLLPAGWTEIPPGEMRVASFKVTGDNGQQADVSAIPLPGIAGGDLSNVNRWRGQVGQPSVTEEELKATAESIEIAGQPAALYDQAGESGRILAVIQHREGTAWFYKMTGDSELVAEQKPVFIEFLKSLRFATGEAPVASNSPRWNAPAHWKEVPGGQFLVAKFTITGDDNAQAAVNVSSSAGDGGGLAGNVNRWRKQLGLSELTGDEIAATVVTRGPATFVEMSGPNAALVGAVVLRPGQAWFYKLMGNPKLVAAEKEAFTKFVEEVNY